MIYVSVEVIMKLNISKSKNATIYYVSESYRKPNGISTSRNVLRLGTETELREKLGPDADIKEWCKAEIKKLNDAAKAKKPIPIQLTITPDTPYEKNVQRSFNVGYLFLQKFLYGMGIDEIANEIKSRHSFRFDLERIMADLIYARILDPKSKLSTYDFCLKTLLERPNYELHDVYRALDIISEESDFIQSKLYQHSSKQCQRDSSVLFYDCTNYYFEITEESGMRKYGHSKENRPNPIVQMGMFIDRSGIPLAFDIFDGNKNEQLSLRPLEKKIINDYAHPNKQIIVCTDAGLASFDNKVFNAKVHLINDGQNQVKTDFITIDPIKKMDKEEQAWALARGRSLKKDPLKEDENPNIVLSQLERDGWKCEGVPGTFSLDDIDETDPNLYNKIFYKEKYVIKKGGPKSENKGKQLDERIIVSYSIKYKHFMEYKRTCELERAQKLINSKNCKRIDLNTKNDIRRYIKKVSIDKKTGIEANNVRDNYFLDEDVISQESRFDGFYAVSTTISKDKLPVSEIININRGRWEIEESFMLMKSELKSRPVYLQNDNRIKAHFTTCFMALVLFRILEKKITEKLEKTVPAGQIMDTLRNMNITSIDKYYTGAFTRTAVTDTLHELTDMRFDCELLTKGSVDRYVKKSKKI